MAHAMKHDLEDAREFGARASAETHRLAATDDSAVHEALIHKAESLEEAAAASRIAAERAASEAARQYDHPGTNEAWGISSAALVWEPEARAARVVPGPRKLTVMTQAQTWNEQWTRVARWFARFKETNDGRTHDRASDYYQDEVYAFFQNAYHLKDWLKNDPAASAQVLDVERFIDSSHGMRLCADLCNGSKHLTLTSPRESGDTRMGQRHFRVGLSEPATISAQYMVEAASEAYDAFLLAQSCMDEWRAYLAAKGLLP